MKLILCPKFNPKPNFYLDVTKISDLMTVVKESQCDLDMPSRGLVKLVQGPKFRFNSTRTLHDYVKRSIMVEMKKIIVNTLACPNPKDNGTKRLISNFFCNGTNPEIINAGKICK